MSQAKKNLEIKETLKSKYAHKYVRGGRMARYMQRLPIRWPHGERWRGNAAPWLAQHLDINVVISTSQDLMLVMFLISFWLETQQQLPLRIFQKSGKMFWRETFSFSFFSHSLCLLLYLVVYNYNTKGI